MADLGNVLLKLNRAEDRARALSERVHNYCSDHPIKLDAQLRQGRLGVELRCQMQEIAAPLREWSVELGEIVYSLRSALDNLIYAYARAYTDPPVSPRDLQFPIVDEAGKYPAAIRKIAPQVSSEVMVLLEQLQPFQRARTEVEGSPEGDPLVLLNWISNQDKHRLPVPFLVPPSTIKFVHSCQFASEAEAEANTPPDVVIHAGPLSHDSLVMEYRTKHPITLASGEFEITASVAFDTHAGRQNLAQALGQMNRYTRLVVNEFAKRIASSP